MINYVQQGDIAMLLDDEGRVLSIGRSLRIALANLVDDITDSVFDDYMEQDDVLFTTPEPDRKGKAV